MSAETLPIIAPTGLGVAIRREPGPPVVLIFMPPWMRGFGPWELFYALTEVSDFGDWTLFSSQTS